MSTKNTSSATEQKRRELASSIKTLDLKQVPKAERERIKREWLNA